jgi:hypothetical protein
VDTTFHTGTPLLQRMTEDMRMRKLEEKTQRSGSLTEPVLTGAARGV